MSTQDLIQRVAIAIRDEVEVLHIDRDFDRIAEHTPLRIAAV